MDNNRANTLLMGWGAFIFYCHQQYITKYSWERHAIDDAFAVPWSTERIYRREADVLPAEAEFDSVDLRMGI